MTRKQMQIERLKTQYNMQKTQREILQVTPEIYAAFAIALVNRGYDANQIEELFAETQEIWTRHVNDGTEDKMIERCFELTGIDVRT